MSVSLRWMLKRKLTLLSLAALLVLQPRILRKFREWRRAFVLVKRLPTPKTRPRSSYFVFNDAVVNVGSSKEKKQEKRSFVERVRFNLVRWLTERIVESPEAKELGIINVPLLTPTADKLLPFHKMCFVVIFGNDKVKELLSSKAMSHLSKGFGYEVCASLIGDSVLSTSGEVWHTQRKVMEKGFTDEMMSKAMPRIVQTVSEMAEKWEEQFLHAPVIVHEEMLKLTMDVLGRSVLNYDFNSVTAATTDEAPLYNAFNIILSTLNQRALLQHEHFLRWLPTPTNQRYDAAISKLNGAVDRIVNTRNEERSGGRKKIEDLLDVMLEAKEEGEMTQKQLNNNIKTILFAGHDTTGAALSWLLYLLSENRDKEAKLLDELEAHFPHIRRGEVINPSVETLEKMDYLNACIQEVLRVYPSAGFSRDVLEEFTFKDGTKLPAGIEVFFLPYYTHRSNDNYEDPKEFKPERWLEQQASSKLTLQTRIGIESTKADKIKYFPFSTGPRNCVGRKLALLEMRVVILNLLNRFVFETVDDPDFRRDPVVYLTLNPSSIKLVPSLRL